MMLLRRALLFVCLLVLPILLARSATAQDIRPWQLSKELRTISRTWTVPVPSTAAATDVTAGRDGVVAAMLIRSTTYPVWTSSIARNPFACKLTVKVHDDSNADTLSCSSVKITGLDQFGQPVVETVAPSGETAITTTHVFASESRIEAAACTPGGGSDDDYVRVSCSQDIGIPFRISAKTNVLGATLWDVSASHLYQFKSSDLTIDLTNYSVRFDNLTPTIGNGDVVQMIVLLDKKS